MGVTGAAVLVAAAALLASLGESDAPVALPSAAATSTTESPATSLPGSDACFLYLKAWVLDLSAGFRTQQDVYYELGAIDPLSRYVVHTWYRYEGLWLQFGDVEGTSLGDEELDRNCRGPYLDAYEHAEVEGKITLPSGS